MAASSVTSVPSPLEELHGSDNGEFKSIFPEDMSWVVNYALQCNATSGTSSVVQLQRFNEALRRATAMAATEEDIKLVDKLCGILPGVIKRATDDDIAAEALCQETLRTYDLILMMLSSPKELPLSSVASLLRPLCQLRWFNTGSNTWRKLSPTIDLYMANIIFSKDRLSSMCSELLQYLTDRVPEMAPVPCPSFEAIRVKNLAFSDVVNGLYTIACWGLSYYGSSPEFTLVRHSIGKLQENVWERLLDLRYWSVAVGSIAAGIDAPTAPSRKYWALSHLRWLEDKRIIWKLLNIRNNKFPMPEVKQLLRLLAKEGLVVKERVVSNRLRIGARRPPIPPVTIEQCKAADLINTTMLEVLDISSYSDSFLELALEWLETRQVDCVVDCSRIFKILRKLLKNDKRRSWEKRFCILLCRCATSVSSSQLADFLREVADHYNTSYVTGSPDTSILEKDDEQAKLLEACSSADMVACISTDMALNHTKVHIRKAETWKDKEIDLDVQMNASSKLTEALSTTFPYTRHETAKKCLERLVSAKQLSIGLNPNKSYCNTFASVIATAMSAELQALEALKNESLVHCKVVQQVEELSERHVREYDALRQEQYERLVKFAEACRKEKEDVVWDALIQKAKVLASVERACVGKDAGMSSEDILKKLVQNAEGVCKQMEVKLSQVEEKHKESLERLPNSDCALCYEKFSKQRMRACLNPCGHASACADCATREWGRTKTCFLCKASIDRPIPVPSQLFF